MVSKKQKPKTSHKIKPIYVVLIAQAVLLVLLSLWLNRFFEEKEMGSSSGQGVLSGTAENGDGRQGDSYQQPPREAPRQERPPAERESREGAGTEGRAGSQNKAGLSGGGKTGQDKAEKNKGTLVFVIDDVGNNLEQLDRFLKIPGPLVFAVMPHCPHTTESVKRIHAAGKMAILHQPMEAVGGNNPGGGAIYAGMSREEVFAVMDENLSQTGPLPGINNHMGSKVTTDPETMQWVMEYLKEHGMFFLDSATNTGLVAEGISRKIGLPYTKRNSMFLDNDKETEKVRHAITEGKKTAERGGHSIMIGHVVTDSLAELLFELYPTFIEDGYTLQDLSEFLRGEDDADSWN